MQQLIIDQLTLIVQRILKESDISDSDYKIRLQENKDKEHGDYASNIAMILAKDLSLKSKDLADQISNEFPLDNQILKVEVAGPGFINFFVSKETHAQVLNAIDLSYCGDIF